MNKKERTLLRYLLENENDFVSSQKIGSEIGLSDKTVRKYLKSLEETLKENGAELIIKQGLGYQLVVKHPIQFDLFHQSVNENTRKFKDISRIEETADRVYFILNRLCFENEEISVKQLSSDLFISKTTASNLIGEVRTILKKYNLELADDGQQGMYLSGEERMIRHFIMDYFFTDKFGSSFSLVSRHQRFLAEDHYTEIAIIVLDECRDAKVKLSDFILRNLIIHILLMIKRINSGFQIDSFVVPPEVAQSKEYRVALNIMHRIEMVMDLEFPEEEAGFIALHLNVNANQSQLESTAKWNEIDHELEKGLKELSQKMSIPLMNDAVLLNGLKTHCHTLLNRLKNRVHLKNPLLETIQEEYTSILQLTKESFKEVSFLKNYEISEDEWAYLTLHIMAAVERYKNKQKLRTLVVCATGVGSAQMLKTRLENEFGNQLTIVDVVSYYEITEEVLSRIDLIVSSIDLSTMILPIPIITVSVFLNEADTEKIKKLIGTKANVPYQRNEKQPLSVKDEVIDRGFKEEQFLVFDDHISKQELLLAMVNQLNENQEPEFAADFIKQIELRERFGSVVFNEHTALPHPTIPLNTTEQVVVAICKKGINWDKYNSQVHFVFLIAPSKGANPTLKHLSKPIVNFIEDKDVQQQLLQEPTFEAFREALLNLNQQV